MVVATAVMIRATREGRSLCGDCLSCSPPCCQWCRWQLGAAQYAAVRSGDVVRLEDAKNQTVVSLVTPVGNIAFEMKVKGENVLRWPYGSVEEFKARPGMSGIPFLGPWANRLDEQAFYANGRKYSFDMDAGERPRRDSDPRLPDDQQPVAGRGSEGRPHVGMGDEPARLLPGASVDEAVSVRPHDSDDPPARERRARSASPGSRT